jgi:hypothetical protein
MNLTDNKEKIEIVSRLVKEGAIDFTEAVKLLELEKEFVVTPLPPLQPWDNQFPPLGPLFKYCGQISNS